MFRRCDGFGWIAALLCAGLIAGCSRAGAEGSAASPQELIVTAADFHFRAPKTVPAGLTRIRLHNEGPQPHHVQLVRLAPGHTYAELVRELSAGNFKLSWATFVGGPEAPPVHGTTEATLLLEPGEYAMICLVSLGDHVPHFAKGMALPLTVTAAVRPTTAEPTVDVRIALNEYGFDIAPEISAGRHTIRVENVGTQPHHLDFVRLGPGRTAAQALDWFREMKGTPPDVSVGGTTALAPGIVNYVTLDFVRGDYALICFVPDSKDGRSHARHGMLRQLSVQ